MKSVFRILGLLVIAVVGFAIVSYVLFGNDPAARLKLELEHEMSVSSAKIRTIPTISGCTLILDVDQIDDAGVFVEGQQLSISLQALDAGNATPGNGFISFDLPSEQAAVCVNRDKTPCTQAHRTEVQLNMPAIQNADQAARVLGWIKELAASCES